MYSSNARQTAHNWDVIRNTEVAMFSNMSELRERNKSLGHKFFDREMMKAFNSKVETALYRGRWFIMSEKGREQNAKRKYKLWEAHPSGEIVTTGDASGYIDIDSAKKALKAIIRQSKGK
jgi:hypothetical protein